MVDPADIPRLLLDAARLVGEGEIVVFGSAALAFWLEHAPTTRDVDVWCDPPEKGDVLLAVMGELSWYHDKHDAYVEVWGPETFAAPKDWRTRAKELVDDTVKTRLVVPHPHDVLLAKLERWELGDQEHARSILSEVPLTVRRLNALAQGAPARGKGVEALRRDRFEHNLADLRSWLA